MNIALVVGHTENGDKGAFSETLNTSEYDYWVEVAKKVQELGNNNVHVYDMYTHKTQSYYQRQKALAEKINDSGVEYDAVIELHFNAASPLAHGTECLYYFASKKGSQIAKQISNFIVKVFNTTIRGIEGSRPLVNKNDRGYWFVYLVKYPAVITELFFGTNKDDCEKFRNKNEVARTLNHAFLNLRIS